MSLFHHVLRYLKNVVHSFEPGETPTNSASHQAPNYVRRALISHNTQKRFDAVAVTFVNLLIFSSVKIVNVKSNDMSIII